jgi:hypothetical protein
LRLRLSLIFYAIDMALHSYQVHVQKPLGHSLD